MLKNEYVRKALENAVKSKTNGLFSPVSLYFVLAMLFHAASAEWQQMVAGTGDYSEGRIKGLWSLALRFYNGVWYQQGEAVPIGDYLKVLLDCFRCEPEAANFLQEAGAVAAKINAVVYRETDKMIDKAVDAGALRGAQVVFLNTTLLKSEWAEKFSKNPIYNDRGIMVEPGTLPGTFYGPQALEVMFMNKTASYGYVGTDKFQSLELRRADGGVVQIVLPKEDIGLEEVLADLDGLAMVEHKSTKVKLSLPKLSGMKGKTDCGNLMGIHAVDLPAFGIGNGPVSIQQVAKAEWDEDGVKMAAVTVAIRTRGGSQLERMLVDRPFLFLAKEADGTVSFVGVVFDPTN